MPLAHCAILVAFIVLAYYPSLDAPFVFDDFPNIVENPAVHPESLSDLTRVLDSPVSETRIIALASFSLNYLTGGLDVFGYHLINILIHIANALLIYLIVLFFPGKQTSGEDQGGNAARFAIPFWAAALWALNPAQTQAVTYIVQRMTSMATSFYLGAIVLYLLWRKKNIGPVAAALSIILCFLLGLASKEIVLTLPLALILLDLLTRQQSAGRKYKILLVIALVSAVVPGIFFLEGRAPDWFATYYGRNFSPWERVMTQWRIVWHYVTIFLFPHPGRLHLAYDPVVSRTLFSPVTTIFSLVALIATWVLAWRIRKTYPLTSFGILFFFLALAVESTFANLELAFIHRLYLPSAFLVPAALFALPARTVKKSGIFLIALLGLWSLWTVTRNDEWNKGEEFWAVDLERGASAARALNNQGAALNDEGNHRKAIPLFREAVTMATTAGERQVSLYNLGTALFLDNQLDNALDVLINLEERHGPFQHSSLYIGQILIELNRIEEASALIREINSRPDRTYEAKILEAELLARGKNFAGAIGLLEQTIEKEPMALVDRQVKLRLDLARIYLLAGETAKGYAAYQEITRLFPQQYYAWTQIYRMLDAGGDTERAEVVRKFLQKKGVRLLPEPPPPSSRE